MWPDSPSRRRVGRYHPPESHRRASQYQRHCQPRRQTGKRSQQNQRQADEAENNHQLAELAQDRPAGCRLAQRRLDRKAKENVRPGAARRQQDKGGYYQHQRQQQRREHGL